MEQWRILFPFEVSIYWHERKNKLNGVWKNKMAFQLYHVPFKIGGVLNKKKPNRRHTLYSLSLSHAHIPTSPSICSLSSVSLTLSLFLSLSFYLSPSLCLRYLLFYFMRVLRIKQTFINPVRTIQSPLFYTWNSQVVVRSFCYLTQANYI